MGIILSPDVSVFDPVPRHNCNSFIEIYANNAKYVSHLVQPSTAYCYLFGEVKMHKLSNGAPAAML